MAQIRLSTEAERSQSPSDLHLDKATVDGGEIEPESKSKSLQKVFEDATKDEGRSRVFGVIDMEEDTAMEDEGNRESCLAANSDKTLDDDVTDTPSV